MLLGKRSPWKNDFSPWKVLDFFPNNSVWTMYIVLYVFVAVHIMLLPSQKPSSSYSLLKFVYVTKQLRHSIVVHTSWICPCINYIQELGRESCRQGSVNYQAMSSLTHALVLYMYVVRGTSSPILPRLSTGHSWLSGG